MAEIMIRKAGIQDFSRHLFWDVDRVALDLEKHKADIVKHDFASEAKQSLRTPGNIPQNETVKN